MKKLWIAFLTVCILLTGCSANNDRAAIELAEPAGSNYNSSVVTREDIYSLKQYPASIIPYTEKLSFTEAGTIDTIQVSAGDKVEKGQLLAVLDIEGVSSRIEELESAIDYAKVNNEFCNTSAQYDIDTMKLQLKELNKEYKAAAVSSKKDLKLSIDIKNADIEIAEEKLAQAEEMQAYQLEKQEQDLNDLRKEAENNSIRAPFAGEIVYISDMTSMKYVSAGEPVIVIADTTKLLLESEYISDGTFNKCSRYYALHDNKEYEITYVPMDINQYIKTILSGGKPTTSYVLNIKDNTLSAGASTSICIINNYKPDVLTVPSEAVYSDAEGKYVYLIDSGTKIRQSVETGIVADFMIEVVSGLEEGEVVYVKD